MSAFAFFVSSWPAGAFWFSWLSAPSAA